MFSAAARMASSPPRPRKPAMRKRADHTKKPTEPMEPWVLRSKNRNTDPTCSASVSDVTAMWTER